MSVSVLAKNTCGTTGEGPHWEESSKSLLYVDILSGDVHRWSTLTETDTKLHVGELQEHANLTIDIAGISNECCSA